MGYYSYIHIYTHIELITIYMYIDSISFLFTGFLKH